MVVGPGASPPGRLFSMIGITLLTVLNAPSPQVAMNIAAIQDRNFQIVGLFCDDNVCETAPRPIKDQVRFDRAANKDLLAKVIKLPEGWSFTLNCKVSRDRLKSCYLTDHFGRSTAGLRIAIDLSHRLRLSRAPRQFARAIINVAYEVSGCPTWYCIPTPAPPAPPAPPLPPIRNR